MQYAYGQVIQVVPPGGSAPIPAQIGEMSPEGPIIHVHSFQMEAPAEVLRQEGWQIPEIEASTHAFAEAASEIVEALINDDAGPAKKPAPPHCTRCGSYAHTVEKCPLAIH